jgi:hypothetical protein
MLEIGPNLARVLCVVALAAVTAVVAWVLLR